MKNISIVLVSSLLLSSCYRSSYEGAPPTTATLGTGIFQESTSSKITDDYKAPPKFIADMGVDLYMFEQQALFRARLEQHAIKAEMDDQHEITLNIPGNLSFSINSATINWNMHAILDKISSVLRTYPDTSITVVGHTDARGNPEINNMLSKQRAESIANYLIRTGVSPDRIIYFGVSDREQVAGNDTTQSRSMNRRVQIIVTPMIPTSPTVGSGSGDTQNEMQNQTVPPLPATEQEPESNETEVTPYPYTDYDL